MFGSAPCAWLARMRTPRHTTVLRRCAAVRRLAPLILRQSWTQSVPTPLSPIDHQAITAAGETACSELGDAYHYMSCQPTGAGRSRIGAILGEAMVVLVDGSRWPDRNGNRAWARVSLALGLGSRAGLSDFEGFRALCEHESNRLANRFSGSSRAHRARNGPPGAGEARRQLRAFWRGDHARRGAHSHRTGSRDAFSAG